MAAPSASRADDANRVTRHADRRGARLGQHSAITAERDDGGRATARQPRSGRKRPVDPGSVLPGKLFGLHPVRHQQPDMA
jgi:hypothetical protein